MSDYIIRAAVAENDGSVREIQPKGRVAWTLQQLMAAGFQGCTPLTHPAPRWSAYVHKLRHDYGLNIKTIHETHDGAFPGRHGRYVLHSPVTILGRREAAE